MKRNLRTLPLSIPPSHSNLNDALSTSHALLLSRSQTSLSNALPISLTQTLNILPSLPSRPTPTRPYLTQSCKKANVWNEKLTFGDDNGNDEAHRFVLDSVIRVWYPFRRSSFFRILSLTDFFCIYPLRIRVSDWCIEIKRGFCQNTFFVFSIGLVLFDAAIWKGILNLAFSNRFCLNPKLGNFWILLLEIINRALLQWLEWSIDF
jgi:hypothetical protein